MLKPENSLQIDATLGLNSQNISIEINAFRNQINNYIFPVKLGSIRGGDSVRTDATAGMSGPAFKYISGDAVLSGGEVMFNIHPKNIKWISFNNAFSFVNAIQKNQGDSTKYLPYTPPYKFQSELKFAFRKGSNTFRNVYFKLGINYFFRQDKIYYKFGNETITPAYTLLNAGIGTDIYLKDKNICSFYIFGNNLADIAYQSNMSRLKYGDINFATGRTGVFNMGRNISFKLIVPISIKG
jgi:iron complex outermembrane recepter protein